MRSKASFVDLDLVAFQLLPDRYGGVRMLLEMKHPSTCVFLFIRGA